MYKNKLHNNYFDVLFATSVVSLCVENKTGPGSVNNLTKQLHTNIMTKKSKNVDVLHLAAEVLS